MTLLVTLDNVADRTVSAPATDHSSVCPINFRRYGIGLPRLSRVTGNQGSIPEREPGPSRRGVTCRSRNAAQRQQRLFRVDVQKCPIGRLRKKRPPVGRNRHRTAAAGRRGKSRSFAFARKIAPKILLHALAGSPLASIKRGNVCARGSATRATPPLRYAAVGGLGSPRFLKRYPYCY